MYERALIAAGLEEKQASVYLACLEAGASKIPEIARQAGIKRTTAYGIIDELVSMGLVSSSYKGKTRVFKAEDPHKIITLLEERKQKLTQVLPALSDLFLTHNARPKIVFFEGREGVKKIYDDILECTSREVRQIVRSQDHNAVVGDAFVKEYMQKKVARKITSYNLHPKVGNLYTGDRGTTNAKFLRHVRYLPPSVFHAAMIMIYDHKVAMVSTKQENFGFIVESKEFSKTLNALFDFMWGLGSKEPDPSR